MDFLNLPDNLYINTHYNENGQRSAIDLQTYVMQWNRDLQIITGPTGSGKSTFAKKIREQLKDASYIDLSCFNDDTIEAVRNHTAKEFVMDGFDELSEENGQRILDCTQNRRVILLSRPEAVANLKKNPVRPAETLVIWPFESIDIENFVRKFVHWAKGGTNSFLDDSDFYKKFEAVHVLNLISAHKDLQSLISNPFMLVIMMMSLSKIDSFHEENEANTVRVKIFQNFTDFWFSYHSKRSNDRENLKKFMNVYCQNVAQYFFNKGKVEMGSITLTTAEEMLLLQPEDDKVLRQSFSALDDVGKKNLLADVRKGALLNYTSGGKITFYHRSFLEYFCSLHLFQNVFEVLNQGSPSKSGISLVSHRIVDSELMTHLTERANADISFESALLKAVKLTRDVTGLDVLGSNAITILNRGGKMIFSGMNLRFVQIPFADLSGSFCGNTDFRGANLKGVNFCDAWLSCARFDGALLAMADFGVTRKMVVEGRNDVLDVRHFETLDLNSFIVVVCKNRENKCVFAVSYDFRDFSREFCRYTLDTSDPSEKSSRVKLIKGNVDRPDMVSVYSSKKVTLWDFLNKRITRTIQLVCKHEHQFFSVMPSLKYAWSNDAGILRSYELLPNVNDMTNVSPSFEYICEEFDGLLRQNFDNVYQIIEFIEDDIFFFVAGVGALFILNEELIPKMKIHDPYGNYSSMAVFPGRKLVALGGSVDGVVIKNYETGADITAITINDNFLKGETNCMAFSRNGQYLACGIESEGRWLVYDTREWKLAASFAERITSIDFFPSVSDSSIVLSNSSGHIRVISYFDKEYLSKKRFESKLISHVAFSDEKMYTLSQLQNHEFQVSIYDPLQTYASTTFDVSLGDISEGPNRYGANVALFSPFLEFDCLFMVVYRLQNLGTYRLVFFSALDQVIVNIIDCSSSENDWQLNFYSKFAVNQNYLAYSTKNEIRLLFSMWGDTNVPDMFRAPDFEREPLETFPAKKVRKLFFEDERLLYYSDDDKMVHAISMLTWEEEYKLQVEETPADFYVLDKKIYYLTDTGSLRLNRMEVMCELEFEPLTRMRLNDVMIIAGRRSRTANDESIICLAVISCTDHKIKTRFDFPLWFVARHLKFHHLNGQLNLIAWEPGFKSQVAVFSSMYNDLNEHNWKLQHTISYCSHFDATSASFAYVYELGNRNVVDATIAPDVDKFVARASLFAPLIHIPTDEPIIRSTNEIIELNQHKWIVSAVRQKVSVGDHVYLLLEGIYNAKRFITKMHLVTHGGIACVSAYSFQIDRLDALKTVQDNLEAQQWNISADDGTRLIDSVLTDKQSRIKFKILNRNCAEWAKRKLEEVGISLKSPWYKFLIILPSNVYKK